MRKTGAPRVDESGIKKERGFDKSLWASKTELGKKVKNGEITDIKEVFDQGFRIMEEQIVDALIPELQSDLIMIGQSKGKFGGGKRTIWKQTQRKTSEGNKPSFSTVAVVGNKDGYVGLGKGKAQETVPAREKANRQAKLNLIRIKTGCGSWECGCGESHSIPFKVTGKVGSVIVNLMPAPKGTGLCVEKECSKILALAGIKDVYSKTMGQTNTKINLVYACFEALKNLGKVKIRPEFVKKAGIIEGKNE
ncbi:30S ribosomal protein S5 [Candidatus Woesearchaeota archaeon]|nr:30S ribosomal protein S5 [Candidatus Woesearchaeota archaeon]